MKFQNNKEASLIYLRSWPSLNKVVARDPRFGAPVPKALHSPVRSTQEPRIIWARRSNLKQYIFRHMEPICSLYFESWESLLRKTVRTLGW